MTETTHEALLANTAASQELLGYFQGQRAAFRADVAQAKADYDDLGGDLKGVVNGRMLFAGTVDVDDPAPTNEDGGTFNSLKALVDSAPVGAYIVAVLTAGQVFMIADAISLYRKTLELRSSDADGVNPIVKLVAYTNATHNQLYEFRSYGGGALVSANVDFELPTEPVDPSLPWSARRCVMGYIGGEQSNLSVRRCRVSGGEGLALARSAPGTMVRLCLDDVDFDGDILGVYNAGSGLTLISQTQLTFSNGAVLTDGAETLGVDALIA